MAFLYKCVSVCVRVLGCEDVGLCGHAIRRLCGYVKLA